MSSQAQRNYASVANAAAAGLIPFPTSAVALSSQQQQLSASYPINPDVKLRKLPFYDILAELLKPSSLGETLLSSYTIHFFIDIMYYKYS